MSSNCKHPTCFDSPVCRREKKPKKIYRLRQFTPKRQKINVEYNREARQFRNDNPMCRINSPLCTRLTQGVHHVKGKATIRILMDKKWWKPACNACNGYVEDHREWAAEHGHKLLDNGYERNNIGRP